MNFLTDYFFICQLISYLFIKPTDKIKKDYIQFWILSPWASSLLWFLYIVTITNIITRRSCKSVKLSTTASNINTIPNKENQKLVVESYEFMKSSGTSNKYQNNNFKTMIAFGKFIGSSVSFYSISKIEQIIKFLDTKIKDIIFDPDKRWITT
jgi:hypothetical protein